MDTTTGLRLLPNICFTRLTERTQLCTPRRNPQDAKLWITTAAVHPG